MKNTYIIAIIILILAVGGFVAYENHTVSAVLPEPTTPVQPVTQSDDMTPAPQSVPGSLPTATVKTDVNTATPAKAPLKEFTVTGKNYSFTPNTISVNKGDTVKITFKNLEGMHDLVIDEYNVKTALIPGGSETTVQFVADKAGSFVYYCSVGRHRALGMWGTLAVK